MVGEPAEAADQDCDWDAFEGVEVDRGTAGGGVGVGVNLVLGWWLAVRSQSALLASSVH